MELEADICVIGAGIVGLAHAFEARRRGMRVVVLDRSARAVGASVRNFGHGVVTGIASGEPFAIAMRARERWLGLGAEAGLRVHQDGSVIVARHPDELAALEAVAADPVRRARMLTVAEVAARVPIPTDGVVGGLHCTLDIRVDPRHAVASLAALLDAERGAEIRWSTRVDAIEPGSVRAGELTVRAPLVAVCPGPDYASLPPEVRPRREGLTLCKLQMLRVAAPGGRTFRPALLTGLSLVRYPAFSENAATAAVRERLERERPEMLRDGIHLIVTQLPDGDLILGDTHSYGPSPDPFRSERLDELVLGEARSLLGIDHLDVRERWLGVYPTAPGDPFMIEIPLPGVAVVEVVAGVGMTTGLGLAERTFDLLMSPPGGQPPLAATRAGCES